MMSELEPKYLLDECIPPNLMDLWSGEYVEATRILPYGTPDDLVLFEAKRRGLVVITRDKGFIQRAINEQTPIIWQSDKGDRFLIEYKLVTEGCSLKYIKGKKTRDLLRRDSVILP